MLSSAAVVGRGVCGDALAAISVASSGACEAEENDRSRSPLAVGVWASVPSSVGAVAYTCVAGALSVFAVAASRLVACFCDAGFG